MKRSKLSFSSIILVVACLVVVMSILYLNVINNRSLISLKASADLVENQYRQLALLRKTHEALKTAADALQAQAQQPQAQAAQMGVTQLDTAILGLRALQATRDTAFQQRLAPLTADTQRLALARAQWHSLRSQLMAGGTPSAVQIDALNQWVKALQSQVLQEERYHADQNSFTFNTALNRRGNIDQLFWVSILVILVIVAALLYNVYKMLNYENEILESRERAEKLALVKSKFLSTMSHEIRSPLTAIMGFTEMIDKLEQDPEKKQYLTAIKTASDHLLSTVNDVLDFSKLDAGKLKLEKHVFRPAQVGQEVVFAFQNTTARKKGIPLELKLEIDEQLQVVGDGFRLRQILFNLVSNAIKFTEQGQVTLGVALARGAEDKITLRFSVRDTGIGIPYEQIGTIFEEFTQITSDHNNQETRRSIKGTGLGLSICKMLVELQGGAIGVDSEPGKGSVFTFTVPYAQPTTPLVQEGATTETVAGPAQHNGLAGKKALVVEDNEVNTMLLTLLLKKFELDYVVAKDGAEALSAYASQPFDIVLTDINVPKLTGDQLAQEIRKGHGFHDKNIPIIALTATIVQDDLEAYMRCGINDVLVKPFNQEALHQMLEKHLV